MSSSRSRVGAVKHFVLSQAKEWFSLPARARMERRFDRAGPPGRDPGIERVLPALIGWLCRAQDCSTTRDGGVAHHYSLIDGWASSYPETTGYIIPTLINYANRSGRSDLVERARRMANWLVAIQMPQGGFQGGKIDSTPVVPVTFNTGQILIGLAAAEAEFGDYLEPVRRAADWLVATQDPDGCWRKHPTPFAYAGEKTYETHVAWGLFEAARIEPGRGYADAGLANVRWALRMQQDNGWFANCSMGDPAIPLTHTIGYALRGVLEAFRFGGDQEFLDAARLTADALIVVQRPDGSLPGRLRSDWSPATDSACLTGIAQVAICWLMLFKHTGDARYRDAALRANQFVRRTVRLLAPRDTQGAVKGSYPVDGDYWRFAYPNWGAKFLADSLMIEADFGCESARPQQFEVA